MRFYICESGSSRLMDIDGNWRPMPVVESDLLPLVSFATIGEAYIYCALEKEAGRECCPCTWEFHATANATT